MAKAKKKAADKTSIPEIKPVDIPIKIVIDIVPGTDNTNAASSEQSAPGAQQPLNTSTGDTVSIEVKIIILAIIGNKTIKPQNLPDEYRLYDDLGYNDNLKEYLHIALNNYVDHKHPGSKIVQKEMDACSTVGDCIQLVKSKI